MALPGVARAQEHRRVGEVERQRVVGAVVVEARAAFVPPAVGLRRRLDAAREPAVERLVRKRARRRGGAAFVLHAAEPLKNATKRSPCR